VKYNDNSVMHQSVTGQKQQFDFQRRCAAANPFSEAGLCRMPDSGRGFHYSVSSGHVVYNIIQNQSEP